MRKKALRLNLWYAIVLAVLMITPSLKAQTVDATGEINPALTGNHLVFASVIFNDADAGGTFDAIFTLSDRTIAAWTDYAAVVAFYHTGISCRTTSGVVAAANLTNVIVPVPGQVYKLWIALDVPNKKYKVFVHTDGMSDTLCIYEPGGDFRYQATEINRWSAVHNASSGSGPDFLTVQEVLLTSDSNTKLRSLTPSLGTLTPAFSEDEYAYTLEVPYGTPSVSVSAVAKGLGASVTGTGEVTLVDGFAYAIVTVTASNGDKAEYSIEISEAGGSSDASLKSIVSDINTITPAFNRDVDNYTLYVPASTTTVNLTATTTFGGATITGDGSITLTGTETMANLVVKSLDESATKTYHVIIIQVDNWAIRMPGVNGTTSQIDISGLNLTTLPYTLELWFKPEGNQTPNSGLLFGRLSSTEAAGLQYASNWQQNNAEEPEYVRAMTNISGDYGVLTSGSVAYDQWHHIAVVVTEKTRTIYLDGAPNKGVIVSPAYDFTQGKLYIGYDDGGTNRAFKGYIDEVRVWRDSLGYDAIRANKYKVLTGTESNLAGYWNFDTFNPATAIEKTGNGPNGVIIGGVYLPSFPRTDYELASLTADKGTLKPGFSRAVTDYYLTLPKGTTSVTLAAPAYDPANATVTGAGTIDVSAGSGTVAITIKSNDNLYSSTYNVHYVVDTELTLKHSYTFDDGTANDMVGTAHGVVNGGTIADGIFTSATSTDYITLPAAALALKNYSSITLEAYIKNGINTGFSMLAYFGGLSGSNSYWMQLSRTNDLSQNEFSGGGGLASVTGAEPLPEETHHYVSVVTCDSLYWYIDGVIAGKALCPANSIIAKLSDANAWLCKSGWNDPIYIGSIYEFNIYQGSMTPAMVADRSTKWPIPNAVDSKEGSSIQVYPTVTNGLIHIKSSGKETTISVIEISGKLINKITTTEESHQLNIPKSGIYLLKVENENESKIIKVVKTK